VHKIRDTLKVYSQKHYRNQFLVNIHGSEVLGFVSHLLVLWTQSNDIQAASGGNLLLAQQHYFEFPRLPGASSVAYQITVEDSFLFNAQASS
jgi:hypothetical protein